MNQRPAAATNLDPASRLSFDGGRIEVDLAQRKLFVDGRAAAIGSRSFDLLATLVRHREQVCSKVELLQAVWPGMVVEENNLHVQITALRKLLGAAAVANVHGRGYAWTIKPDVAAEHALFGREALLAAASALLAAPSTRLLTLHGPGGVGKTRLARALLESTTAPRDGYCLLALAPLTPEVDLADALARALGLRPNDKSAPLPLLLGHLARRQMLLVLDNVEHLPGVTPLLVQLLQACPLVKLLTTSRSRTKLEQEVTLEVPPLPVPDTSYMPGETPPAALRLFLQRASDFGHPLSAEQPRELQAAAHICRQLDGLPLALELAAARLRLMSATTLQEQIERTHRVVGAGSDVTPGRQRSLHDTLRWSTGLLSPGARRMLHRLGVFRGGFDLTAALTVATDVDTTDLATAMDRLTELLDMHLVQRQDAVDGQVRYTLLETIRQFAVESLRESGEHDDIALRHAAWYTQVAETHDRSLRSRQRNAALAALACEQANVRSALGYLVHQRRDAVAALRLVGAMSWAWYFAGTLREGRQWQDDALALPIPAGVADAVELRRWHARALSGACRLLLYLDDTAAAVAAGQQAVALAREACDAEVLAYALFHLAIPTRRASAAASVALHDEAHALFGRLGDAWGQALTTCYGGIPLAFDSQQQAAALQRLGEGRQLFEKIGDDWGCNVADQYLSVMALRRGDLSEAQLRAHSVYRTALALDDGFRMASALHQLGRVAIAAGRFADAESMLLQAAQVNFEQGRQGYAAHLLRQCARLLARRGDDRLAARVFGAASADLRPPLIPNVLPEEIEALEVAADGLRDRLGPRMFAECHAQGGAWGLDEAIDKARRAFASGKAP